MGGGRALFVVPGGLERVTGGNLYDEVVIRGMRDRGWTVDVSEQSVVSAPYDCIIVDSLAFPLGRPQTSIPYVALAHQLPSGARGFPEPTVQERDVLRFATLVVTVSEWLHENVASYTNAPVVVAPPAWDGAFANEGTKTEPETVVTVANAAPGKGVPEAIEAFGRGAKEGRRMVLVGDLTVDRDEEARVREALDACPFEVETPGVVDREDLARRYSNARVFLTASRYEGWPIAVAEAMASGVPVVGYDVPGMRELVRVGRDGVLARTGDVGDLAGSLGDMLGDPDLADAMGRAARRRAMAWPTWADTATSFVDAVERFRS